jgi:hypothetical protein
VKAKNARPTRSQTRGTKTEDRAQARTAKSAQPRPNEQATEKRRRPSSRHGEKSPEAHVEEYGTGTPVEETS